MSQLTEFFPNAYVEKGKKIYKKVSTIESHISDECHGYMSSHAELWHATTYYRVASDIQINAQPI
jgi:hypothetical protein